jgi:hypothetical protein
MTRRFLPTLLLLAVGAAPALAQVPDTLPAPPDSVPAVEVVPAPMVSPPALLQDPADPVERPMSAGGAFLRSILLPGWGQAAFGAYTRGGIYFSGWTGNWFMNFKNQVRLTEARNRLDLRTEHIRDMLIAQAPDPDSMRAVLDTTNLLATTVRADAVASDLRALVGSREQQREDWIAWSLFWMLASGIDAFVTAHLADFPAAVDLEPQPDGGVSLRVEVPLPGRRR